MKTRIHHIRTSFLAVAAFLVMSSAGRAEDFTKNYGLKFKSGIGFYIVIDGVPHPLTWTVWTGGQMSESDIVQIPFDVQFYSYGLDFSTAGNMAGSPLPPHLLGYRLSYMDMSGKKQGSWAARFVPVAGYEQKVYRLVFEGPYEELRNDKLEYRFLVFEIPPKEDKAGFLFHFATAKFAEAQKKLRAFITQALSNKDKTYKGKLSNNAGWPAPTVTPFQIRFTSYDEKSGKVETEVSGLNEKQNLKFTGQLIGNRQLMLKQTGGSLVWDLELFGEKTLVGSYPNPNGLLTSEVEIALEDAPTK